MSFQENPYALEEDDVYERNPRFERFSFTDSHLRIAEMMHASDKTPLIVLVKQLAPELVTIVNCMFTTMTMFPGVIAQVRSTTDWPQTGIYDQYTLMNDPFSDN